MTETVAFNGDESEVSRDSINWEAIYIEHRDAMFRKLRSMNAIPNQMDDTVQDTFVRAIADNQEGKLDELPAAHLVNRTWREHIDNARSEAARKRREHYYFMDRSNYLDRSHPGSNSADIEYEQAGGGFFEAAMKQLVPHQREALELRFIKNMAQSEIAEKIGVSLGTLKSRQRDALIKLREWVSENGLI